MSGYDLSRFVALSQTQSEEMLCGICLAILNRPIDTSCGHTFCWQCLNQWVNAYDNTCPQCRRHLSIHEPFRESTKRFQNLINCLQMRCDFVDKGCDSVIRLGELTTHLNECQFNEYKNVVKILDWIGMKGTDEPNEFGVIGGHDLNGEPLYVGRAHHMNDLICGKIVRSHECCYVPYNGHEFSYQNFEMLTNPQNFPLEWIRATNGFVPPNAIEGGKQSNGEILYIGRVSHLNSITVGKVHPSHRVLYIPFGGQELNYKSYEILCFSLKN